MEHMEKAKKLYMKAVQKLSNKLHLKTRKVKNDKIKVEVLDTCKINKAICSPDRILNKNRNRSLENELGDYETLLNKSKKNSSLVNLGDSRTWDLGSLPYKPGFVIRYFAKSLTFFEHEEIMGFKEVYFIGKQVRKFEPNEELSNFGFDDDRSDYILSRNDHIAYRYEILEILGRGSYGQVIKAYDHKNKIHVAMKIIRNIPCILKQAKIEIQILRRLSMYEQECEYLISIIDNFIFRSHICITFHLLPMNLYEYHKSKNYKALPSYLLKIFSEQILSGIKFFHNLGILHCDLKPENIMLSSNKSSFKIIDFGSGCFLNRRIFKYIQSRYYRSPEVILELGYDQKIDIWSFGCILAELVIGKPIFIGRDELDLLQNISEILGPPPHHMLESSRKKPEIKKLFKKTSKKSLNNRKTLQDLLGDDQKFINFVSRNLHLECLSWDPTHRPSADEALNHEWLAKDLKHGFSLPALKIEKYSNASISNEITQRKMTRAAQSHKKLMIPQETPMKSFIRQHLLN